jgi:integrase
MRKIESLPSGRYKVRFRSGVSQKTGKPKQTSETFPTKAQAQHFAKMIDAIGPDAALDDLYANDRQANVPTMNQIAAAHIKNLSGIEEGTRDRYTRMWERNWSPHIGNIPANRLTRDHVSSTLNLLAHVYSAKTLKNQRGLLAAVCGRAVDKGYLKSNPTKGVKVARSGEADRRDMRILTPADFDILLERVTEHYRPFVRFLAGTGCRWGEAVALQVGDFNDPNIMIRRALKGDRTIGPPKTRKSRRTIRLPDAVLDDVTDACADRPAKALVWTAPKGGMIQHRTFWSDIWFPAVTIFDPRPRIHDLRHTHAAWLLAAGVPIHVVQARLGHESITTTVDTYGGLMPDAQVAAAAAADLVFAHTRAIG